MNTINYKTGLSEIEGLIYNDILEKTDAFWRESMSMRMVLISFCKEKER